MITMFIYYDTSGNIRAITPSIDNSQDPTLEYGHVPFKDVEPILTGQQNLLDYIVLKDETASGVLHTIVRKTPLFDFKKTLNDGLSEVQCESAAVLVENYLDDRCINIEIRELNKDSIINLYFTKKLDPHVLIKTINIHTRTLTSNILSVKYTEDLSDSSLYVHNQRNNYGYKIIKGKNDI